MRRTKSYPNETGLHSCNQGNTRICEVCQYNDDCPFVEEEKEIEEK